MLILLQQVERYDRCVTRRGEKSMINQVTLVGRLTRDPELRLTTEGTSVTSVTLAVNRPFRNQQGEVGCRFCPMYVMEKGGREYGSILPKRLFSRGNW